MTNKISDRKKVTDIHSSQVVTRIAPSPTGFLHIGTARSALFNYLFARQNNGKFIVRIEDTDRERSKKEFEDDILEGLKWLGLESDELYRQSERTPIYKKYIEKMLENGSAYLSKEKSKKEGQTLLGKEIEVVRLKNPNKKVEFEDMIRGKIEFDTTELKDFVVARSVNEPLYHLAVVVDDYEMKISHVIRGEDHISNTPRQILIQEALGLKRPLYAHIPLILAPDRSKLSKRRNATSVREYRENGYLPEALLNYMALLGWNPGDDRELFTLPELIKDFDINKVQKGGAVFNVEKLNWFNREYMKKMSKAELLTEIGENIPEEIKKLDGYSNNKLQKMIPIIQERIHTFSDVKKMAEEGELDCYFKKPDYEVADLLWKNDTDLNIVKMHLEEIISKFEKISDGKFNAGSVKESIWKYAESNGRGSVLWPMRFALSGKEKSPDPFVLAEALGKEETISRLEQAIGDVLTNLPN
jgi:glutamyl-tRNA synthetase